MSGNGIFYSVVLALSIMGNLLWGQNLQQVIQFALKQNKTIHAQNQLVEKATLEAKATWRTTLPMLDFKSSYHHVTHVPQIEFPAIIGTKAPSIQLGAYDSYENSLTVRYTLFSGFALINKVRLMAQKADLEKINLEEAQKEIAIKSITLYRQVQRYQLEIQALNAGLKRIDLQLMRVRPLIQQGMALSLDTLSLTLSKLKLRQKHITVTGHLKDALHQLSQLAGQDVTVTPFSMAKPPKLHVRFKSNQTIQMKKLRQYEILKNTQLKLTQSGFYPKVFLFASYNYGKPGLDMIRNEWMDYGVWGVNLQWNLFSWFSDRLKTQAAKVALKQIYWQKQAVKDQSKTRFDSAVREWKTLMEQFKVRQLALRVAITKMNIVESRYKQGMATVTDFNQANLELTEAELKVKSQLVLLALKQSKIEYISGQPINQWSI